MIAEGHNTKGRFAPGNPGGPGRPRRAVERDYLAALSEAVTLADWRDIVKAAVLAAKQGDSKARDWLARYLLGEKPPPLTELAAAEITCEGAEQDIALRIVERAEAAKHTEMFATIGGGGGLEEARKKVDAFFGGRTEQDGERDR